MKQVVIISDLHCGHKGGLVPPGWQKTDQQRRFWDWFRRKAKLCRDQSVDTLVINGDALDGKGKKSGGVELITTDRKKQCDMAARAARLFSAKRNIVIPGTPYHTGHGEDWEEILAAELGGEFHGHFAGKLHGVPFDIRHHIDYSKIPHGRATALLREQLLSVIANEAAKKHVTVRSHAHYRMAVDSRLGCGFVTPCLQLWSKFSERKLPKGVDIGFLRFYIEDRGGGWTTEWVLYEP